jgi:hypothetical protein
MREASESNQPVDRLRRVITDARAKEKVSGSVPSKRIEFDLWDNWGDWANQT